MKHDEVTGQYEKETDSKKKIKLHSEIKNIILEFGFRWIKQHIRYSCLAEKERNIAING